MPTILVIGGYPPPIGGNTVHIKNLTECLVEDGWKVHVIDLYNWREIILHGGSRQEISYGSYKNPITLSKLSKRIYRISKNSVVHIHMSAGRNFYPIAPILLSLTKRANSRVLTIHSGSWVSESKGLPLVMKSVAKCTMRKFDTIICVNSDQAELIKEWGVLKVSVIPAHISRSQHESIVLPEEVTELRKRSDIVIVTSGSRIELYGYTNIIEAISNVTMSSSQRVSLVIATYGRSDADYWELISSKIRECNFPVSMLENLTSEVFQQLLSVSDIYVRATAVDGDSIAIREAAEKGLQILASDVSPRPIGSMIFRFNDQGDMNTKLADMIGDNSIGKVHRNLQDGGNYSRILKSYGIATRPGPS